MSNKTTNFLFHFSFSRSLRLCKIQNSALHVTKLHISDTILESLYFNFGGWNISSAPYFSLSLFLSIQRKLNSSALNCIHSSQTNKQAHTHTLYLAYTHNARTYTQNTRIHTLTHTHTHIHTHTHKHTGRIYLYPAVQCKSKLNNKNISKSANLTNLLISTKILQHI